MKKNSNIHWDLGAPETKAFQLLCRRGFVRLGLGAGIRIAVHVVADPAVQPRLAIRRLHEGADLVARHHLQIMREAAGRHQVGQAGGDRGVGGGFRAVVFFRLLG